MKLSILTSSAYFIHLTGLIEAGCNAHHTNNKLTSRCVCVHRGARITTRTTCFDSRYNSTIVQDAIASGSCQWRRSVGDRQAQVQRWPWVLTSKSDVRACCSLEGTGLGKVMVSRCYRIGCHGEQAGMSSDACSVPMKTPEAWC